MGEASNLQELTTHIVNALLGEGGASRAGRGATAGENELCAGVTMSGTWNGTLVVRSSPEAVRRAAEIMLSVGLDAPSPEDLRDFLEEIANLLAHNLKAVVPGVSASLPFVLTDDAAARAAASGDGVKLDLAGEPMVVELIAKGSSFALNDGRAP